MAEMADVFDDPEGYGCIQCPGCENSLFEILEAFREGRPCPRCDLPADVARTVIEARRKGAERGLQEKYLEAVKRAVDAERECDALRERMRDIREAVHRPL